MEKLSVMLVRRCQIATSHFPCMREKMKNHEKYLTFSIFQTKRILLVTIILTEKHLQLMILSFSKLFQENFDCYLMKQSL